MAVCASGHGTGALCPVLGATGDRTAFVTTLAPGELANQQHAFYIGVF